jgi:hypothetical protein
MKYIYLITSPSGKQYIGKSTIAPTQKFTLYRSAATYFPNIKRPILEAIRKYGWDNMKFEIIEQNNNWTSTELNEREKYWIHQYETLQKGYNLTSGGDGHDSESAKLFWQNASDEWKEKRSLNCSIGQKRRYKNSKDSIETKKRKSESHKGTYKITSPEGQEWITNLGLKEFSELYKDKIKITYWGLFSAYRKCYNSTQNSVKRKNENLWKVIRIG